MKKLRDGFFNISRLLLLCVVCISGLITILGYGCSKGGSSSSTPTPVQGLFIDSAVEGLNYQTSSQSGLTGSDGSFNYIIGDTVTFSIADVFVGQTGAHNLITPICLVSGATNEMNPTVTNICCLLQSLDLNGFYGDGITITTDIRNEVAGTNIDFEKSIIAFQADPDVANLFVRLNASAVYNPPTRTLINATTAQNNFRATLVADNSLIACVLSPACQGSGTADAAPYNAGVNDPHLIILINSLGDAHTWNTDLPAGWRSTSVNDTQLVACIGDERWRIIERCEYTVYNTDYPPTHLIERLRYELEIIVVEAQTGTTVGTYTLLGSLPDDCPPTVNKSDLPRQKYYGSHVSLNQVLNLLDGIVNP